MESIFDRLDPDQMAAVKLRKNGAVSAGAGSGKTTVLAARYLDLVLESGADVASILCLTFTRKAAAEMRSRVWRELSRHDSPRAKEQAQRFAEAAISTIDSFSALILRSSAQLYGYPPDFRVDNEATRELVEAEALRFLLARREESALIELFAKTSFETAWRGLFAKVADRFASPAPRPEDDLASVPARARETLLALGAEAIKTIALVRDEALVLGPSTSKAGIAAQVAFSALPEDLEAAMSGKAAPDLLGQMEAAVALTSPLARLKLGFGRSEGELRLKEATRAAREAALKLAGYRDSAAGRPLEDAVLGELASFVREVSEAKRRAGLMGFRDVALASVHLLTHSLPIREWWKRRYRYIMVDEFQDDDELQKELLYLLAEAPDRSHEGVPGPADLSPDKLFFVGDDKQSIFRFRGADVSVFNRLSKELVESAPKLRTNYRSEPALIAFFNDLFSRLLAHGDGADFEARFEEALARKPKPGVIPTLTLLWKARRRMEEAGVSYRSDDEALAEGIVQSLQVLIEGGRLAIAAAEGGTRSATWDDVAILFRSTSKQYLMERFLRLHGIPYSAASVRSLFVEAPAHDLFALLTLALQPGDRPAWAALLRSPFVGLGDEAFVTVLASERGPLDDYEDLDLPAQELLRMDECRRLLEETRVRVDREPLAGLVSWLWYECGQRLSILTDPSNHAFLEHFDYLFALAAESEARGENLALFLDRLGPLIGTPEKLDEGLEVPREAAKGLRLMTIHRSKGLEFPVVVLPWIESGGRKEGKGEAWYLSEEAGLSLNLRDWDDPRAKRTNVFFDAAKELEEAQDLAETKRLFYVACTRASAHLLFAGVEPGRRPSPSAFLSFLGGAPRPDGSLEGLSPMIEFRGLPELDAEAYAKLAGRQRGRALPAYERDYREASVLDRSFASRMLSATAIGVAAWEADPRRGLGYPLLPHSAYDDLAELVPENLFGDLCHALLEASVKGQTLPPDHPSLRRIPSEACPRLVAEAQRLAAGFLSSPLGGLLASAGSVATEKALLLALNGEIIRCRLDLVILLDAEVLVIDWKSGRERRGAEYEVQLALYRRALQALYPGRKARSLVFWLRSGEAEEIDVDFSDEALLAAAQGSTDLSRPPVGDEDALRLGRDGIY
ncbi:MAG: UvrD-helicase domain-containing protein [Spirochaetota bacterium]